MAAAAAHRLSGRDRTAGSVLVEADWPADADLDNFSVLRRAVLAADLFHRLQTARRGIGMERAAPGRCAAERRTGRIAGPDLRLGLFALKPKILAGRPAEVRHAPR